VIEVFLLLAVADMMPAELTVPLPRNAIQDISVSTVLSVTDPSLATAAVSIPRVSSPAPPFAERVPR
jgi:hypothetical protein